MTPPALPSALLFDLDGVLIDSYEVWFHLVNDAASTWGYASIARDAFDRGWGQGVEADVRDWFPRHDTASVSAFYDAHFEDHVGHLEVASGVGDVFDALEARALPSVVMTNTPNPLATRLVQRARARVGSVVGGTDVARAKPAPDMVVEAARRAGVRVEGSMVIGDSDFDALAARAAGARFAGIRMDGELRFETLPALADWLREAP